MEPVVLLLRAAGFYALIGSLVAAWIWQFVDGPRRAWLLRYIGWLVVPGYVGVALIVGVLAAGIAVGGCDPVLGGWTRNPSRVGLATAEILSCRDRAIQARARPGEADRAPLLPLQWSQVYQHYDASYGGTPTPDWVWIFSMRTNELLHVPRERLEFRSAPPRQGGLLWWEPLAASPAW
jgi:hypothetical protein